MKLSLYRKLFSVILAVIVCLSTAISGMAVSQNSFVNIYSERIFSAEHYQSLGDAYTKWVITDENDGVYALGTGTTNAVLFTGSPYPEYDMYFDFYPKALAENATRGALQIFVVDLDNTSNLGSTMNLMVEASEWEEGLLINVLLKVSKTKAELYTKSPDDQEYEKEAEITLSNMSDVKKGIVFRANRLIPLIKNNRVSGYAKNISNSIPDETVYSEITNTQNDINSGIYWEKAEGKDSAGFKAENGALVAEEENAYIRYRKYFSNPYMISLEAQINNSLSFAVEDSDGNIFDKITFDVSDKTLSLNDAKIKTSSAFSFEPNEGRYVLELVCADNTIDLFIKQADGESYDYLGKYESSAPSCIRPVIISEGIGNIVYSLKVGENSNTDKTEVLELNTEIENENVIIQNTNNALSLINGAEQNEMRTALSSDLLNVYSNDVFAGLEGEDENKYKDAFAEIIFNFREELEGFENIDVFNEYVGKALELIVLSRYTGDLLVGVIDNLSYNGIENTDEDYLNNNIKTAELFAELRNGNVFKNSDGVIAVFKEAKALSVLNAVTLRDNIASVVSKYAEDLSLDLTVYNKMNTTRIDSALLQKNFRTKEAVQKGIDNKIAEIRKEANRGGGGASSSSGGGSSKQNSNNVILPPAPVVVIPEQPTTVPSYNNETVFEDLDDFEWAEESIEKLYDKGIINGVSEKSFEPERYVTRAELVTMIVKAFGLKRSGNAEFSDVGVDKWYAESIAIAASNEIISGVGNGLFMPESAIKRQDAALILYNAAKPESGDIDFSAKDKDKISGYAKSAVGSLYNIGVINGDEQGFFSPVKEITRAEAACMIYRLLKAVSLI